MVNPLCADRKLKATAKRLSVKQICDGPSIVKSTLYKYVGPTSKSFWRYFSFMDGHTPKRMRFFLQSGINITRTATIRKVASDIDEIAPFATFWANLRRLCGRNEKFAPITFPVSQTATGTDISYETAVCRVSTVSTHPFFSFVFHSIYPL